MKNGILMSTENPTGWKLEELLAQLQEEIRWKTAKVINDGSPQAGLIVANNNAIISCLAQAESLQKTSMYLLDAMAPNEGT
jgi:hypothetical protein